MINKEEEDVFKTRLATVITGVVGSAVGLVIAILFLIVQ